MLFRCLYVACLLAVGSGGCGGCDGPGFPDAATPDATTLGTVSLAWWLIDFDGHPITCDQVAGRTVALQLRNQGGVSGVPASFSCGNSPSVTQAVASGTYNISFELHGDTGTLSTVPDQIGVMVTGGVTTVLAPVTFTVDARGSLALAIAAPPATSNCNPTNMNGAGITGTSITLVDAGGSCAPVTFIRSRGATQLGTYTVNCSSPPVARCVETDETLTVPRLPSGPYTVHVRGSITGVDCWKNDDAIQVPPKGQALNRTLNLAHQDGC